MLCWAGKGSNTISQDNTNYFFPSKRDRNIAENEKMTQALGLTDGNTQLHDCEPSLRSARLHVANFLSMSQLPTQFIPLAMSTYLLHCSGQHFSGSKTPHYYPADGATVGHVKIAHTTSS